MPLIQRARYGFMRDIGAPLAMGLADRAKARKRRSRPKPDSKSAGLFGPPLKSSIRLKEIMTRHYLLARYAKGAGPVAWVSSGAPVELLRGFGYYTVYPENHGALCGARRMGPEICREAEDGGYHPDLCSYARIDLGHALSGRTPVGRLPKPDLLVCSNNICQTIMYWFKELAHHHRIPLLVFDTPFVFDEPSPADLEYMTAQLKEMIPALERASGRVFSPRALENHLATAQATSRLWGECLATMKQRPAPMTIFDAFIHLAPVVSLRGLDVAREYYELLLAELHDRVKSGVAAIPGEKRRLMWDNIAIWYKVRDFSRLFAEHGSNFVAATYTNAWAETIHHLDPADPFGSLAKAYGLVILNNNLAHRLRLMTDMAREFGVDGLVIHSARSCKPYSVGQYDIKRLMSDKLGIPAVVIEADITDYRAFSEEQAGTRLEAFFEALGV